ncbi:hypothetical protein KKH56_05065 [bacterium]|nr:hypothetical protein [bacterium]
MSKIRVILSFLSKIAEEKPSEALDISLLLLNQKYNATIELFFYTVSKELSEIEIDNSLKERYAELFEQMLRGDFGKWYYEVLLICKRVAKYFPEKGLRLYFDSVVKELRAKENKIGLPQESIAESFNEVLPAIYEKIPYQVLLAVTDLFKQIFRYSGEENLPDWPDNLLYSEETQRFGLDVFYEWYKCKTLEFCSNLTEETRQLIEKLHQSEWETQRQLSMLCKIKNISHFKDDVLIYASKTGRFEEIYTNYK